MRLDDLKKWALPESVIELWRQRQGELLLPIQRKAVRQGLLGKPGERGGDSSVRMLISAPTSAGKSFCGEMAMVKALTRRQKTVVLVPLKSLAEHRYRLFRQTYGRLGVKNLIVTGDYPENDRKFARGDYQIAVVIYEKFDLHLTADLDSLKNIGLIVVDEVQTVSEPGRGAIVERLLTKVRASVYQPSLVCLSAVIGDSSHAAGKLAQWLDAALVEEERRPVELLRGIAADGTFYYRSYNSGIEGKEPFTSFSSSEKLFDALLRHLVSDSGTNLVFLKSRRETVEAAFRLAAMVNWQEAKSALEKLREEEPSFLVRSLRQALSRGVAFHNADLSPRQRHIVEDAFIAKEVKVIFATTTLALGVDFPADTVYLETVKYTAGEYGEQPTLMPVSRAEFDNMTGRAGRLRPERTTPGRAVILAETAFEREILWEHYIAPEQPEPIRSAFSSMALEDWALDMIAGGLAPHESTLEELFRRTLYAHLNPDRNAPSFEKALERLAHCRFIERKTPDGAFSLTPLGKAVATTGLSTAQAAYMLKRLSEIRSHTLPAWTALALSAPGWTLPPGMLGRFELSEHIPLKLLHQHFDYLLEEAALILGEPDRRQALSYTTAAKLKAFLLLEQWGNLTPIQQLEERFHLHLGHIMSLGETAAHLVSGLARLLEASDYRNPWSDELKVHAFTLRFGIPPSLHELHHRFGEILHRGDFLALQRAGIFTAAELAKLSAAELGKLITGTNKVKTLITTINSFSEEVPMQLNTSVVNSRLSAAAISLQPESVEIDGSLERERYLVKINGFPVWLTGKSFKYFTRLAWWRRHRENGWIYKEELEVGFNQARYLYRMKNEITSVLSQPWVVFENNRLGYYRLNIDPSKIRLNYANLKHHPDYEVRSLVGEQNAEPVN